VDLKDTEDKVKVLAYIQ